MKSGTKAIVQNFNNGVSGYKGTGDIISLYAVIIVHITSILWNNYTGGGAARAQSKVVIYLRPEAGFG